jgi:hypothetical protein
MAVTSFFMGGSWVGDWGMGNWFGFSAAGQVATEGPRRAGWLSALANLRGLDFYGTALPMTHSRRERGAVEQQKGGQVSKSLLNSKAEVPVTASNREQ